PERVFASVLVTEHARAWGVQSGHELILPLTVAFVLVALAACGVRLLLLWANTKLSFSAGADLSIEVYRRTLYQPYAVHVARNSSEIVSGITGKVGGIVYGALLPLLTLVSASIVLLAVVMALLAIDTTVALTALAGFGAIYAMTTWISKRRLLLNGEKIAAEQTHVLKAIQEGLGGIRDVLLEGSQPLYCDIYRRSDQALRRAQGSNMFIASSPRFSTEALGMILIAALAYGLTQQENGVAKALPVLGALVLGAQRLLPALQQIYGSWAGIVSSQASLVDALELLDQPLPPEAFEAQPEKLDFRRQIEFDNVCFRYTEHERAVLDGVNFVIHKGSRIGLVGTTGSGKSTTVDLLMGLLDPVSGQVRVDGEPVSGPRRRAWQQSLAHVPQTVYLADASFAENIAFGVSRESIDMERVKQAAVQAQVADFIESRQRGYDAYVGERGIQISGGQRQRIGIARALYKRASVLVFDEATSALDNVTERAVMSAIDQLDRDLTIIIIAHRLTTVQHCDAIIELDKGHVRAVGTYEYLLQHSQSFRQMTV
ncbi:MAG: ABC transporter ATP-binding protein, partial [Betaproteobacteria bacterium]